MTIRSWHDRTGVVGGKVRTSDDKHLLFPLLPADKSDLTFRITGCASGALVISRQFDALEL